MKLTRNTFIQVQEICMGCSSIKSTTVANFISDNVEENLGKTPLHIQLEFAILKRARRRQTNITWWKFGSK